KLCAHRAPPTGCTMAASRLARHCSRQAWIRAVRSFSTDLKQTLTYEEHLKEGGKMVDFAGYAMPVQYEAKGSKHALSIIDSTKWTRESASLFDVSHMCSIRWTGKDAFDFVERVTTADVYGLPAMTGSLSVITNERGGVIDDTLVTKCSSKEHGEHVYQVVNAGCAPKDLKHFEEQLGKFGGDVKMEVMWDNRGLFAIQGPKAAEVLQRLSPSTDLKSVPFGQCFWMTLEGAECLVSRCGYTGEDGFEVFVPGSAAVPVWQLLTSQAEVRLAGLGARDSLRLEAGLCLYGDEILAQLSDKSRYKRLRAGLMPASGPPAREGAEIETLDGQVVGKVTSGSMSPCLKKNISIGYINKPHNKQGTDLQVVVRGKRHPAKARRLRGWWEGLPRSALDPRGWWGQAGSPQNKGSELVLKRIQIKALQVVSHSTPTTIDRHEPGHV
ncbi:Aminomethyltransferase, partial [Durusdinium trenchii]